MCESAYNSPLPTRRLTESCCSSPARSIRSHNIEILSDSDGEFDDKDFVTEIPGAPDQTVIAGWLKFRDNKKVRPIDDGLMEPETCALCKSLCGQVVRSWGVKTCFVTSTLMGFG